MAAEGYPCVAITFVAVLSIALEAVLRGDSKAFYCETAEVGV